MSALSLLHRAAAAAAVIATAVAAAGDIEVTDVPSTYLTTGYFHTCGLKYTQRAEFGGIAVCWGFDDHGQVSGAPSNDIYIQISAGHLHTCAIRADERAVCWGGPGGKGATVPAGLFSQISAGEFHTCGLSKGGDVKCWGADHEGRTKAPPGRFLQVAAGAAHSCGIRPDGTAECWGANDKGQSSPPTDAGAAFVQLSASLGKHTCGVTTSGELRCWGSNSHGQAVDMPGKWAMVSTGLKSTCGIRDDDRNIYCWGMRMPLSDSRSLPNKWQSVVLGQRHICGFDVDGTTKCWGPPGAKAEAVVPQDFELA